MAKKKQLGSPVIIQSLGYCDWFKLTADDDMEWQFQLYHEQNITIQGALCRDKPLKIRSNTGVERTIPWDTKVFPTIVDKPIGDNS